MDMLTPKQIADGDQAFKLLAETLPAFWRSIFVNLVSEGFSEEQSMELLKHYITVTNCRRES